MKSDSKDFYIVTNDLFSIKCCSFELSIHPRILKQHIRMISDRSSDQIGEMDA